MQQRRLWEWIFIHEIRKMSYFCVLIFQCHIPFGSWEDPYLLNDGTDSNYNQCGGKLCRSVLMPQQSHSKSPPQNWSYPGTFLGKLRSGSGHGFVFQLAQSEMIKSELKMRTYFLFLQEASYESLKYFPDTKIQNISHCLLLLT